MLCKAQMKTECNDVQIFFDIDSFEYSARQYIKCSDKLINVVVFFKIYTFTTMVHSVSI